MPSPTQSQVGYGIQLWIGDGNGPEVFTKIAELVDAVPPDRDINTVEATHMESANRHVEKIAAMASTGDGTFTLNFLPTDPTQKLLRDAQANFRRCNFRVVMPAAWNQRFEGPAFVAKIGRAVPMADKMLMNITLTPATQWDQVVHP